MAKQPKSQQSAAILFLGILIFVTFISIAGIFFAGKNSNTEATTENIRIEDGKQIIEIKAKGGYSPQLIEAKAGIETILRVSTKNSFDCSTALRIPDLDVSENLPTNGTTDIELGSQDVNATIDGTCSMGMYSFKIKFI